MVTDGRRRGIVVVALLLAAACTDGGGAPASAPTSPAPPSHREATRAHRKLVLEAGGRARVYIGQAVRDLRSIGFWQTETKALFEVQLDARFGRSNVPRDEHLADSYYTATTTPPPGGTVCDVMFFPRAIIIDLARWRGFWAQGRIDREPPAGLREYYASLLAHELGHCQPGDRDEQAALRWERRALDHLRAADI
ncbi:MAG TPA: hypothetical protein VFK89_04795 [Actinomycetota bacterium]|nr:hypothetical protein [Actinomycetota bacterium]